jgi:hypothetical protein
VYLISIFVQDLQDNVQGDRDDPEPPLVTRPFGHASQVGAHFGSQGFRHYGQHCPACVSGASVSFQRMDENEKLTASMTGNEQALSKLIVGPFPSAWLWKQLMLVLGLPCGDQCSTTP